MKKTIVSSLDANTSFRNSRPVFNPGTHVAKGKIHAMENSQATRFCLGHPQQTAGVLQMPFSILQISKAHLNIRTPRPSGPIEHGK